MATSMALKLTTSDCDCGQALKHDNDKITMAKREKINE
jgi:hypothetical protein